MIRVGSLAIILVALQFSGRLVRAETPTDALERELKQVQDEHTAATSKQFTDFISALDQALQSPDQAFDLYKTAGGEMPDPAPVITTHADETPDEQGAREAQDQAVNTALASVAQLHCGVMRFAAYFIQNPDQKGLHDSWVAWLKQVAQTYPQAGNTPSDTRQPPTPPATNENGNQRPNGRQRSRQAPAPEDYAKALKDTAVRDSIISTYLGYSGWGDKDQGTWRVRDIPRFYRSEVLDPLRVNPSAATLAAWDVYIAMKNADQSDSTKWTTVDYPTLQFERGCDAFYASPSDEKLQDLVVLIKNNPTYPDLDGWLGRVKQMLQDYRTFKSTGTMPPAPSPDSGTNAAPASASTPSATPTGA